MSGAVPLLPYSLYGVERKNFAFLLTILYRG